MFVIKLYNYNYKWYNTKCRFEPLAHNCKPAHG